MSIALAIGFIGVGNMGGAMAANLLARAWNVHVHDIEPSRTQALASNGARVAQSPLELARETDVIIIAVVNAAQTEDVLFGAQGIVHAAPVATAEGGAARASKTVLLCPTIAPKDVERFTARLMAAGFAAIDAPMSGGPERAREGEMSLMVACPLALFHEHQVLLQALASRLFHVSERQGDGARTKLVNNLLAAINLVGAAEALALAQRIGLEPKRTLEVIEQSSGQSWIGSDRLRRALDGDEAPRAHMSLLTKDSGLALEMARRSGFAGPLGAHAHAAFAQACQDGWAHVDDGALYRLLQQGLPTIKA